MADLGVLIQVDKKDWNDEKLEAEEKKSTLEAELNNGDLTDPSDSPDHGVPCAFFYVRNDICR